jgi:G:T-mismatch repair DNA endonuclease (very short patch repair protein)
MTAQLAIGFQDMIAESGDLGLLEWTWTRWVRCKWEDVVGIALDYGHLNIVKRIREMPFGKDRVRTLHSAAWYGHLEILEWAWNSGYYDIVSSCEWGHIDPIALRWYLGLMRSGRVPDSYKHYWVASVTEGKNYAARVVNISQMREFGEAGYPCEFRISNMFNSPPNIDSFMGLLRDLMEVKITNTETMGEIMRSVRARFGSIDHRVHEQIKWLLHALGIRYGVKKGNVS